MFVNVPVCIHQTDREYCQALTSVRISTVWFPCTQTQLGMLQRSHLLDHVCCCSPIVSTSAASPGGIQLLDWTHPKWCKNAFSSLFQCRIEANRAYSAYFFAKICSHSLLRQFYMFNKLQWKIRRAIINLTLVTEYHTPKMTMLCYCGDVNNSMTVHSWYASHAANSGYTISIFIHWPLHNHYCTESNLQKWWSWTVFFLFISFFT